MFFISLSKREKVIFLSAAFLFLAFCFDFFIFSPFKSWHLRMQRSVEVKEKTLLEIKELSARYKNMQLSNKDAARILASRREDFTLFTFLERVAGETGLKKNIASMKPGEFEDKARSLRFSLVEMRIEDISMKDLTRLIFYLETAPEDIKVRSITISKKTGREPALLSLILNVQALARQG